MHTLSGFEAKGTWLRCALHAHTTNSDGEASPAALAAHYERAGYDVLCITDHWVRTVEENRAGLLVVPGVELNATLEGTGSDSHVLALGVEADPVEPGGWSFPNLQETVDWIRANGGLPFLAHPYWSGLHSDEFLGCDGLLGLEVFNAGCELEVGRGLSAAHWDEALERGMPLYGLATDDSHLPGFDSGHGSVWVRAAREPAAVLQALAEGSFYGSTGPLIHALAVDEETIEVRCDPAASVGLVGPRCLGARANAGRLGLVYRAEILERTPTGELTAVRLRRTPSLAYGRIEYGTRRAAAPGRTRSG